jgi:hypothetical protein
MEGEADLLNCGRVHLLVPHTLLDDVCDAANLDQFEGWRRLP